MARRADKYREMNTNELEIRQRELSEQIFRLRFQLSTGQAEGLKKLREAKRDFARVKTLLRENELRKADWQTKRQRFSNRRRRREEHGRNWLAW
jgi:large subunit ribosomal protein L29